MIVKHGPVGQINPERSQHWDVKGAAYRALHDGGSSLRLDPPGLDLDLAEVLAN